MQIDKLLVGQILGFRYIIGKTAKERQYSWNNAPVSTNVAPQLRRGINVQATWYKYSENGTLLPIESEKKHFFNNIENYIGTTKAIGRSISGKLQLKIASTQRIYFNEQLLQLMANVI